MIASKGTQYFKHQFKISLEDISFLKQGTFYMYISKSIFHVQISYGGNI